MGGLGMVEHYQNERSLIEHKALGEKFPSVSGGHLVSVNISSRREELSYVFILLTKFSSFSILISFYLMHLYFGIFFPFFLSIFSILQHNYMYMLVLHHKLQQIQRLEGFFFSYIF